MSRLHRSDSTDAFGCLMGMALGAFGFPLITYVVVPFRTIIDRMPVLFWVAMFAPFAVWVLYQLALSAYAAAAIRPVPVRDWQRTGIAGGLMLLGSVIYVGPWIAAAAYEFQYGRLLAN